MFKTWDHIGQFINTGLLALISPSAGTINYGLFVLVFASSVQSGFLPPKRATVDRNRSRTDPDIEGTEPNHLGPVYFGLWSRFRPIQTGFFAYNLLYQYKPFVS
ncbi:uncharacterized protein LACBIDRAFT_311924 [Laccaria bicolor S238N-H82]|uniref:Predicted protein n=1 Tax=Laccaria bicolor (strain S238N-H82 / ATCC MYA-4686) TaxID=486041 RepID=B0CYM3_LACBS|nr:uncharacterized protein LACBIDRAFT_311924 [Laccaria bicolor S238N-H82]EDR12475.1 predicted protein [Laccaria bicolor S238N-H82]|eukprot:XP_001876739.1 predicted protein [Laccaria bicolor S238N-H82]